MVSHTTLRLGITAFAGIVAVALVAILLRHRERASARSLLGVGVVTAVGSFLHLLVADLTPPNAALAVTGWDLETTAWVMVGTTVVVIADGLWVLFAFRYAGRSRCVIQATAATVATISLGAVSITAVALGGPTTLALQLLTVAFLLVGFLVTIGVFLLVWTSIGQGAAPLQGPLVLSAGAIVLLSGSFVAQLFERPVLLPAFSSLASGLFLVAVVRYPVFEMPAAARVLGRDRVVDELADGILIADRRGQLRDLNPAAEQLFDISRASVLGQPIGSLFPTTVDPSVLTGQAEPLRVELADGTALSVTADHVTDGRNRIVGSLVRCTDVTDRQRREEQLTLLSRFVVEVIRGRMAGVADEAETYTADSVSGEPAEVADHLWKRTTNLTALVAQTRSIEQAIAENGIRSEQRLDAGSVLRELRDAIATGSGRQIEIDDPGTPIETTISPELLDALLEPVLEDACAHAEARVEIAVDRDRPTIRIADDRATLDDCRDHGRDADLPLAVTRLALEQLDGSLSVEWPPEGRRTVIVRLPTRVTPEPGRALIERGDEQ
ncbi:PAS domain-containing protein [Halorhabdus rudnickae]|uniref:PAS domain-containing protein n=1 Tax=Halorhabdus rudnickae TaxID=1775544 RepID=UPI00108474D4|nr:PAS domain-containing protein [Halorhabdus rudnickae]